MKFSLYFPFDEEDDIFMDAEMNFPGKSLIHPPVAGIKPLSLITKVGNQFSLNNQSLEDILKNPTTLSSNTSSTNPGAISESPFLDFIDASSILAAYLKEMGLSNPNDVLTGIKQYESIAFELTDLNDVKLDISLSNLDSWLTTQEIDDTNSLVQQWRNEAATSLFVAMSVGTAQSLSIHLQPENEDLLESGGENVNIDIGPNKQVTFSGGAEISLAVQIFELIEEDDKIIIKDPSKGGGGGRGRPNPSG